MLRSLPAPRTWNPRGTRDPQPIACKGSRPGRGTASPPRPRRAGASVHLCACEGPCTFGRLVRFPRFCLARFRARREEHLKHSDAEANGWRILMRKALVSLVFAAALAAPVGWASAASAKPGPDPDANGDVHSNCHTGSKFRGAGGEDRPGIPNHAGDLCQAAPVTPPVQPVVPVTPSAARPAAAPSAARPAAAPVRAPAAAPAAPIAAAPRTTG